MAMTLTYKLGVKMLHYVQYSHCDAWINIQGHLLPCYPNAEFFADLLTFIDLYSPILSPQKRVL